MCLAVPVRIVELKGERAIGEVGGVEREVSVVMTPEVKIGDYVIVHAGFAIQILDQAEAEENLKILQQMAEAVDDVRAKVCQTKTVQERRKHGARLNPGSKV